MRVSMSILKQAIDNVNSDFKKVGKVVRVSHSKVGDNHCLYIEVGNGRTDSVCSGTIRECLSYLQGMQTSITILNYMDKRC